MTLPALTPFEGQDLRSLLDAQAAARGDHPFLAWEPFHGEGTVTSYATFREQVRRFAAGLQARGVKPGDRVLVHLDNCPEFLLAWLGCAYAGAVAVTTNAKSSRDEIAYFAQHSGAVGGVTQPRFADLVAQAAPQLAWLSVERVVAGVAGVREVAVVARRHPMLDEAPVAFVIPLDLADTGLPDRIAAACKDALAEFKRPHEVRLVPDLPRSTLEKVAKAELRAMLAADA